MSDVYVTYFKANSAMEGYHIASTYLQSSEAQSKFPVEINFSFVDGANPKVIGSGKGFDITLTFLETKVTIDLNLKLMLRPLKGRIIDSITDEIKKVL